MNSLLVFGSVQRALLYTENLSWIHSSVPLGLLETRQCIKILAELHQDAEVKAQESDVTPGGVTYGS